MAGEKSYGVILAYLGGFIPNKVCTKGVTRTISTIKNVRIKETMLIAIYSTESLTMRGIRIYATPIKTGL